MLNWVVLLPGLQAMSCITNEWTGHMGATAILLMWIRLCVCIRVCLCLLSWCLSAHSFVRCIKPVYRNTRLKANHRQLHSDLTILPTHPFLFSLPPPFPCPLPLLCRQSSSVRKSFASLQLIFMSVTKHILFSVYSGKYPIGGTRPGVARGLHGGCCSSW